MKNVKRTLIATACGLAMSAGAHAATVAFEYTDPEDFRDIQATDVGQKGFEAGVLKELEEQFRDEAAALPEGQTLRVTLKNVDLAGDIEYFHSGYPFGLRVIRDIDFPKLEFSYVLLDANGDVLAMGEDEIKDMSFRVPTFNTRNQKALDYERALISEWYDETFRG